MSMLLHNLRRSLPRELIKAGCKIIFKDFITSHQSQIAYDYQLKNATKNISKKVKLIKIADNEKVHKLDFGFDHLTRLDWGIVSSIAALVFFGLLLSNVFLRKKPKTKNIRQENNSGKSEVEENFSMGEKNGLFSTKKIRGAFSVSSFRHFKRNTAAGSAQSTTTNGDNSVYGEIGENVRVFFEELNSKSIKLIEYSYENFPYFVSKISKNVKTIFTKTHLDVTVEEAKVFDKPIIFPIFPVSTINRPGQLAIC